MTKLSLEKYLNNLLNQKTQDDKTIQQIYYIKNVWMPKPIL